MQIAENLPESCTFTTTKATTGLLRAAYGDHFYREMTVVNHSSQDVVMVDTNNVIQSIPKSAQTFNTEFITVSFRTSVGSYRTTMDRHEIVTGTVTNITIPIHVLNAGPLFIQSAGIVLSLTVHASHAVHPASAKILETQVKRITDQVIDTIHRSPITILANYPHATNVKLYAAINDQIVVVVPTQYRGEGESDSITVAIRKFDLGDHSKNEIAHTSFEELLKTNVLTVCGIPLSLNKDVLEHWLSSHKTINVPTGIPLAEHDAIIKKIQEQHKRQSELEKTDAKMYQHRCKALEQQLKELEEQKYSDRTASIKLRELELQDAEQRAKAKQMEYTLKREREKRLQEQKAAEDARKGEMLQTITTIAKTVGVVAPIAFGIWKLFSKDSK